MNPAGNVGPPIRIALSVGLAYGALLGGSWLGIYTVEIRIFTLVVAAVVLSAWGIGLARDPTWRPRTSLGIGFGLAGISWLVSTSLSRAPRVSLEYAGWAIVLVALYLFLVQILRRPDLRKVLGIASLGVALAISIGYIGSTGQLWLEWWSLVGHVGPPPLRPAFESLTYGNPSAVLTVTLLLWLAGTALVLPARDRASIAVIGIGLLVLVVALISGSRSGWLAMALGGAIAAIAGATMARHAIKRFSRRLMVPAALVLLVGGGATTAFLPGILARISAGGQELRLAYAASAIRMFDASPIIGTGPGTWAIQRISFTAVGEPDAYVPHAHDVYLQALAEFGILGGIAGVALAGSVLYLIWRALRADDNVQRGWGLAALFATTYFATHNVLDSYANMPAALMAWSIPIALLDAAEMTRRPATIGRPGSFHGDALGRLPAVLGVGAVGLLVAAIAGLSVSERWAAIGDEAARAGTAGDWATSYALASEAVTADPEMTPYQVTLGLAAAALGHPDEAAVAFRSAAERDGLPLTWLDLAVMEANLGHSGAASMALVSAMRLGRQQAPVALGAAAVYLRLGDRRAASDALVASLIAIPGLAADPEWRAMADDALGADTAIGDALDVSSGVVAWEIALTAGKRGLANNLLGSIDGPTRETAELVTGAFDGDATATSRLIEHALSRPFDRFAMDWAGRMAIASGRLDDALRVRRLAELATSDAAVGYAITVTSGGSGVASAGDPTTFYGPFTYRRLTPLNKLVGTLATIEFK